MGYEIVSYPLTGIFQLFSPAKNDKKNSPSKQMLYKMVLNDVDSTTYSFHGVKHIHKSHWWQIGLRDTTILFVNIYRGAEFSGNVIGTAELKITVPNFAIQLATMEITNSRSNSEKLYWLAKFGEFFSKALWNVYGPGVRAHDVNFDNEETAPRQMRVLNLQGCIPVVYECETKDEVSNW